MRPAVFPIHLEQSRRASWRKASARLALADADVLDHRGHGVPASSARRSRPNVGQQVTSVLRQLCDPTKAFQWDRVRYEGDPYSSMNTIGQPRWNQRGSASYRACVDGLDAIRREDADAANAILTSLKDAQALTESALVGLANLERASRHSATPQGPEQGPEQGPDQASRIAQLFGITSPTVTREFHAALNHQFGFLLHAMRRLQATAYKTISITVNPDLMIAGTLHETGMMIINLHRFLSASPSVRAWTMLHELIHLALGGYDHFYLDIEASDTLDRANLLILIRQHDTYLSAGSHLLPWLCDPDVRGNFAAVMGCHSLVGAVARFRRNERERMEVLLHHPDSLTLNIFMLAATPASAPVSRTPSRCLARDVMKNG